MALISYQDYHVFRAPRRYGEHSMKSVMGLKRQQEMKRGGGHMWRAGPQSMRAGPQSSPNPDPLNPNPATPTQPLSAPFQHAWPLLPAW